MNISTIPTSLMKASKVDKAILPQAECEISSIPVRVYQQIYQAILNGEDGDLNIKDLGSFGDLMLLLTN